MKKNFTLLSLAMLFALVVQAQTATAPLNTFYPGLTAADSSRVYKAPKATVAPTIDGNPTDAAWQLAPWKSAFAVTVGLDADWAAGSTPAGNEGAFSGAGDSGLKYKIVWDAARYYMLFRIVDDQIVYTSKHNGYQVGRAPAYVTGLTFPAAGAGDGTIIQPWRMDQLQYFFTPYTEGLASGATSFNRANDAVYHNFWPGRLNPSNPEEPGTLWAAKHNPVSTTAGTPQTHESTAVISYNETEKAYYIEFRDTTWATLYSTVRNRAAVDTLINYVPKVGHKFLMNGEYNDADGITNRRDYQLSFSYMYYVASRTSLNNLAQAMVIELVETISGLKNTKATNKLEVFPNPAVGNVINLNRVADVQIFNLSGYMLLESKNTTKIDISGLKQGVYMVKDNAGSINKLVRQ